MKSFRDLREKTLTPAEKKKREEIAKSMERDNPGMDMGKKMAIATATAKKVAEEQNLDEAKTHFVYQRGVPKTKQVVHRGTEQSSKDWITKNAKHYAHKGKDFDIYKGKYPNVKPSDALNFKHVAEEVELDEAPQPKWIVTVVKPVNKLRKGTHVIVPARNTAEALKKALKRMGENIDVAIGARHLDVKLYKPLGESAELEGLDEVLDTPKAMDSYRNKAKTSKDKATNSAVANILRKGDHSADLKTRAKREKGLKMADRNATKKTYKALRGESTLDEAKDPNEYDREGEMMKGQLRQICSANEKLMKMVGDDDNLPEWVQNKVTKATDYIRSVRDYLESENDKDSMSEASKSDMLCKECGDQFGKPTNEKCMYDAYDQLGENWVTKEMYEGLDITEISLDMLTKKISNTNLGNTRKAMKTDKVKDDLAKMRARLNKKKSLTQLRGESAISADKKPEKYIKPDGKAGIRMVRVNKNIVDKDA